MVNNAQLGSLDSHITLLKYSFATGNQDLQIMSKELIVQHIEMIKETHKLNIFG